ncbi:hypothetical protein predicted by Glimmer/Critica [Helicobacter pylori B8]|uniref:Uncharacterized protein n=1 Tax=Helicobacter pylori (strain B8) TaxID=693745 RepID=D7FEW8_HELP3|nr:hypothetical protein predicted by Glimmer/Critica [Helicobacter pylori B8]
MWKLFEKWRKKVVESGFKNKERPKRYQKYY